MNDRERRLSIEELAAQVGLPVRTVRFYIAEGLIPGPGTRGKAATYTEEHLLRLRLACRLAEQHVPLTEIRAKLGGLTLDEVRSVLDEEDRRAARLQRTAGAPSPREYVSELLQQARAVRPPMPASPRAALAPVPPSAAPAPFAAPPPASAPPSAAARRLAEPALPYPAPQAEAWQRWELAPGVELHVRGDVAARFRALTERVLRAARGDT